MLFERVSIAKSRASVVITCDQVMASFTNTGVLLAAARVCGGAQFGKWAICFTVYTLTLGISEAVAGDPQLVLRGRTNARLASGALAASAAISSCGACVVAVVGWSVLGLGAGTVLLTAGGVALLVVQDAYRFVAFAAERPAIALKADSAWATMLLVAMCLGYAGVIGLDGILGIWLVGGCASAMWLWYRTRVRPRFGDLSKWMSGAQHLAPRYAADYAMSLGYAQGLVIAVGAAASVVDAGAFRACQAVLGPIAILINASRILLLPRLVEMQEAERRFLLRVTALLLLAVMVYSGLAYTVLTRAGIDILGDLTGRSAKIMPALALQYASLAVSAGAAAILRVHEPRWLVRLRALSVLLGSVVFAVALVWGGILAACYGLAAASAVMMVAWCLAGFATVRRVRPVAKMVMT